MRRFRIMEDDKRDSSKEDKHRGKKTKGPTRHVLKSYRSRTRGRKALQILFSLLKSKRSKTTKRNDRDLPNTSFGKNNVTSPKRKLLKFRQKHVKIFTESEKEISATERESTEVNRPSCSPPIAVVPLVLSPRKKEKVLCDTKTENASFQDNLLQDRSLAEAMNSTSSPEFRENNATTDVNGSHDGFEGSYFEDDYLSLDNQYDEEEDIKLEHPSMFSTPTKRVALHQTRRHVHMGVSSLRSRETNMQFTEDNASSSQGNNAFTNYGNKVDQQACSPLAFRNASALNSKESETQKPYTEIKPGLTDKEIENLPPFYPSAVTFVFEESLDESTSVDVEGLDTTHEDCEQSPGKLEHGPEMETTGEDANANAVEIAQVKDSEREAASSYKAKKPKDLQVKLPEMLAVEELDSSQRNIETNSLASINVVTDQADITASPESNDIDIKRKIQMGNDHSFCKPSSANIFFKAPVRAQLSFGRQRIESGYDSCGKTPLDKNPPTSAKFEASDLTAPSTSNLSPASVTWSNQSETTSSSNTKDLQKVYVNKEPGSANSYPLKKDCPDGSKLENDAVKESNCLKSKEGWSDTKPGLEDKAYPVKRSLNFLDSKGSVLTEPPTAEKNTGTVELEVQNRPKIQHNLQVPHFSDDGGNNHLEFDFNVVYERPEDVLNESVSSSKSLVPIFTSSPMQKTNGSGENPEDLDLGSPSAKNASSTGFKRPASANTSKESNTQARFSKKPCGIRKDKGTKSSGSEYFTTTDGNPHNMEFERGQRKINPGFPSLKNQQFQIRPDDPSSDEEGESSIGKQSSSGQDYILMMDVAETILRRIPVERCKREMLNIELLINFLYERFQNYLVNPNARTVERKHLKDLKWIQVPARNVSELKDRNRQTIGNKTLIIMKESLIEDLLMALLADRTDVVDECCGFALHNVLYLATNPSFLACPPEVVLMILCYKHYQVDEQKVFHVAYQYCQHKFSKNETDDLWDLVMPAVNERLWNDTVKSSVSTKGVDELEKERIGVLKRITWHLSKKYAEMEGNNVSPHSSPDYCVTDNGSEPEHGYRKIADAYGIDPHPTLEAENAQTSGYTTEPKKMEHWRDCRNLKSINDLYMLRQIWYYVEMRRKVPYITGLQVDCLINGDLQTFCSGYIKPKSGHLKMQGDCARHAVFYYDSPENCPSAKNDTISCKKHSANQRLPETEQTMHSKKSRCEDTKGLLEKDGSNVKESGTNSRRSRKLPFTLMDDEYIVDVYVQCTTALHNMAFITNRGRSVRLHACHIEGLRWTRVEQHPSFRQPALTANSCRFPTCLQMIFADTVRSDEGISLCNVEFVWATVEKPHTCSSRHCKCRNQV